MNSPHKGAVTRKMLPFDDVIMALSNLSLNIRRKVNNIKGRDHIEKCQVTVGVRVYILCMPNHDWHKIVCLCVWMDT